MQNLFKAYFNSIIKKLGSKPNKYRNIQSLFKKLIMKNAIFFQILNFSKKKSVFANKLRRLQIKL